MSYADVSADPIARNDTTIDRLRAKPFAALLSAHVADHQALFRRVRLELGEAERPCDADRQSVLASKRLSDPGLAALFFQYGRYLLIASQPPGHAAGEPAGDLERQLHTRRGTASARSTSTRR